MGNRTQKGQEIGCFDTCAVSRKGGKLYPIRACLGRETEGARPSHARKAGNEQTSRREAITRESQDRRSGRAIRFKYEVSRDGEEVTGEDLQYEKLGSTRKQKGADDSQCNGCGGGR